MNDVAPNEPAASLSATIASWSKRLETYRARLRTEPQFNPIRQLAFDLSRELEGKAITQDLLALAAKELADRALIRRATSTRRYVNGTDGASKAEALRELVRLSALEDGRLIPFAQFRAVWERPRQGVVFTAHPTFAMSPELRAALVALIDGRSGEAETRGALAGRSHGPEAKIELSGEHIQAQEAIGHAQHALERIAAIVLDVARELYPADWPSLRPCPVELNSWVGYDLDGRTDIGWEECLRFRLDEKRGQLAGLLQETLRLSEPLPAGSRVRVLLDQLFAMLAAELEAAERGVALFAHDLSSAEGLSLAANDLTSHRGSRLGLTLTRAEDLIGQVIAEAASPDLRVKLACLATRLHGEGLGTARIHMRVNSVQVHNAIRKPLGLEAGADASSRVQLARLDTLIAETPPASVNFASLAIERATVIRQFIVIAQILKHIDADTPIRLLIAECESPFTVLSALYFARLFGVEDKVDISPLFETERALDRGARVIEQLLRTKSYRAYVEKRGRLSIQTGFSDAGRFVGQVPATFAIERLHGQLSDVISAERLRGIEILIFDTHGESMGRGGHPASLADRFDYVMSPWARRRFQNYGLDLIHETSFQGGDGFVFFGSRELAFATLTGAVMSAYTLPPVGDDRYYAELDFTRDLFERVKTYQTRLFEDKNYHAALAAFGTNLLVKSGSRRSQRQYDASGSARSATSELRAIPHNALLQQLGYTLNVVSGIGSAAWQERDRFGNIHRGSDRLRRVMALVRHGKQLSSIKTLVAYASLFDDAFWVTRPYDGQERPIKEACLFLADLLRNDSRHDGMIHLAAFLRKDALYLHDLLREIGCGTTPNEDPARLEMDVMHAIRIALIQHIFLLAARVPAFSTRDDIARDDIIRLILSLRVHEAVELLRAAFPRAQPTLADYALDEPATYTGEGGSDYSEINRVLIDPILDAYGAVLEIGVGISHHFGAYG